MLTPADPQARWLVGRFDASVIETPTGPVYELAAERVLEAATALAADGFVLSSVTAVDRDERIDVVIHLAGEPGSVIALRVPTPYGGSVPSLSELWPGADWQERETAEMFGVVFEGHPDPRRLLLTDDFVGYPLRKSFSLEGAE